MSTPKFIQPVWKAWMAFSHAIGVVMSSILLTILWVFVFGAYAIIFKIPSLFMKKVQPESFWWDTSQKKSDLHHQF